MKVQIAKASKGVWYENMIGDVFVVDEYDTDSYSVIDWEKYTDTHEDGETVVGLNILKEHCRPVMLHKVGDYVRIVRNVGDKFYDKFIGEIHEIVAVNNQDEFYQLKGVTCMDYECLALWRDSEVELVETRLYLLYDKTETTAEIIGTKQELMDYLSEWHSETSEYELYLLGKPLAVTRTIKYEVSK